VATYNVLWYTGGAGLDPFFSRDGSSGTAAYKSYVAALVVQALAFTGNTWNVTFWDAGAIPAGSFDCLVIVSNAGSLAPLPSYTALSNAIAGGLTFNPSTDRVLLCGEDADWHYMNEAFIAPHIDTTQFDSPTGFLINAINYISGGTTMGLLAPTFSAVSLFGFTGFTENDAVSSNNITFPTPNAISAILDLNLNPSGVNTGMSNWVDSAHSEFTGLSSSWLPIQLNGDTTNACYLASTSPTSTPPDLLISFKGVKRIVKGSQEDICSPVPEGVRKRRAM